MADIRLASLRLFTCLVYVSTYCVPIAHLRQNKPFPLLYLGHAQIKIIHLVSVPQVRDNACQETLLIDSERGLEALEEKKFVLSLPVHIILFFFVAGSEIYFLRRCFDCAHCFFGCCLAL